MTKFIALVLFLSASIGRSDGYSLDRGETPRPVFKADNCDNERISSVGRTTLKSLSTQEPLEADFSDDECFPFEPLQIQCEINGFIIPAIVDTGAQVTVMSESCARRCRVANQIDGRYSGKAVGIGSSDILGRINQLQMRVGPITYHNKVSILRQSRVDLIVGLDFLRRFGAEINLDRRILKLNVRGRIVRIPFMYENKSYLGQSYHKHGSCGDNDSYNNNNNNNEEEDESYEEDEEEDYSENNDDNVIKKNQNLSQASESLHKNKNGNKDCLKSKSAAVDADRLTLKQDKKEREFVILNSKLNHRKHDDSNDDNEDGNDDNNSKKSYLSMEGV